MNLFQEARDKVKGSVLPALDLLKRRTLGANNERLDFVMDSFYKLSANQQTGVLAGVAGLVGLLVIGIFAIYFSRISALEAELNNGYEALQDLRILAEEYRQENGRLDWLTKTVDRKTSNLRPKPFFEQKANQVGVTLEGLRSEEVEIPEDDPLSRSFKQININFRLTKISIPRLLKFLSEIEKSDKFLTTRNLKVRARFGDRLFFDAEARVSGYKVGGRR